MKPFQSLNLATRFNLLNAALVLLTALSVGFIVTYKLLSAQFDARHEYNQALVSLLAESSEYAVYTRQYALLEKQLDRLADLSGLAYVAILDADGNILARINPRPLDGSRNSLIFWRWWQRSGGQGFSDIVQAINSRDLQHEDALFLDSAASAKTLGQVRLAMNPAYFEIILRNTFLLSLAVVLLILVVSLAIFMLMTAHITRPLKQLSEAAHQVIEGQLAAQTLDSGGPELQELGKAFNLMINWLSDYHGEVQSYQAMLERQAYYDDLTGLANRVLLKDHLQQAISSAQRRKTTSALLFLDLDRFKYVNDTLGHSFGDRLLQQISERLRLQLRAGDTVARMGGDEFIVILNDLHADVELARRDTSRIARQIGQVLSQPFSIHEHNISTSFSIGIAFYPHDGESGEELTRNADCAMYEAKTRGRNTYHFYDPSLQQRGMRRLYLENGLKQALELDQLSLYFQPKYDSRGAKLIGAEALLRWRFQDVWVSPVEFIPLAEETGLILPIGEWVLETALRTLAEWRAAGIVDAHFHMAVNVAPSQFWHPRFAQHTLDILRHFLPDAAGALELELTESCLLRPTEESLRCFDRLRRAGVRFAVDDFGTGYSSLSYLKQFPLDVLKIDQSFVRDCIDDPSDATIIRAIIAMARGLGLEVIAEGVETTEHAVFLRDAGCYLLQGYLLAKPMSAEMFAGFCRDFARHPICGTSVLNGTGLTVST
ncbi:EAL domain-containing protein [Methylomonas sp. SURF-2]|uniref:EAL domain-containing protein n=1 Tax=Methylomonas subterranea TaxID=2952225 RepID=A0ABT1TEG8_9GAMM|nr:EAL domain-containing protein [Methylomonas sp. SURF-2]MCQ8103856.1 EAL domain-containing protein [Methylomonas sp. SURF-2]